MMKIPLLSIQILMFCSVIFHQFLLKFQPRVLINGEVHDGDGDGPSKENGSCSLGPLPESEEADNSEEKTRLNFIEEDFEGVMVLCTKCLECECITEMKEAFYEIGVPIVPDQDPETSMYICI